MPDKYNTPALVNRRFLSLPATRLGWWAVGLAAAPLLLPVLTFVVNLLVNELTGGLQTAVGVSGLLMVVCGIAGGVTALIAVLRRRERSILLWFAMLIGLFFLFLIAGEFIVPH